MMFIMPQNILLEILPSLCLVALSYIGSHFNFRDPSLFSNSSNCCFQVGFTVKLITSGSRMYDSLLQSAHHTGKSCQAQDEKSQGNAQGQSYPCSGTWGHWESWQSHAEVDPVFKLVLTKHRSLQLQKLFPQFSL